MATAVLSSDASLGNIDDKSLEIFQIIWLNANATAKGNRHTEQKLRSIISQLKKFKSAEECQEYIQERSLKDRFVLIVSGSLGRKIVPSVHKFRHIISIYVFCMDKKANEQWASRFPKIKAVVVELDELVSRISVDHKIQKKIEEPLLINIFTTNTGGGTSIKEINDKNELIECCKNQYQGNYAELENINEFEKDYSSEKVLWWYTRESFFYKILNGALRTQNIHMIFLFREFIFDIHCKLQKHKSQYPLQVYRSQLMSNDELKTLQNCIGQFISINSFFSTSIERETALFLLGDTTSMYDFERVLFEIEADPKIVTTKSFANISKFSDFPEELEVLFMIGSIFRVEDINRNSDEIWIIRMTLCSEDEHDFKKVLMYMKQQIGSGDTNLQILGKFLCKMDKFKLAEDYFSRLLNQLSPDDPLLGTLYEDLGELASLNGDFDKSVKLHQKSLAIKDDNPSIVDLTDIIIGGKLTSVPSSINTNTKWKQNGVTIAGGNGEGNQLNQLNYPHGIYVDDKKQTIYIADWLNHRIVDWKSNEKNGQVVADGHDKGNQMNQLNYPTDVIVDEKNNSFIICDNGHRRVVRWSRENPTNGETIIDDIVCWGLTMDNNGNLYVSDSTKHEVRRWEKGDKNGMIVAGGNGKGNNLNQLNGPGYLFFDENHSVYVSDQNNHRVIKWMKGAKEGIIVAGGHGYGNRLTQLYYPAGVFADQWENVYVADFWNHRIMRWSKGSKEGSVIIGGDIQGNRPNQLARPEGLSFDQQGNLYVVDSYNHRVQKFLID